MLYYTIENPTEKPNQHLDIPFGSIVYIALRPDAFPNLYLPVLSLDDGEWPQDMASLVRPSNSQAEPKVQVITPNGLRQEFYFYSQNGLTLSKLWMYGYDKEGLEPFTRVVNAKVYGFTRTIDGVITKTVDRYSYTGTDGNTYLFDVVSNFFSSNWGNPNWRTTIPTFLGILRNSEGTILGNATYLYSWYKSVKVGRRNVNAGVQIANPSSVISEIYADKIPTSFILYRSSETAYYYEFNVSDEVHGYAVPTNNIKEGITFVGSVEITDCPNIIYTVAEPITIPVTFNCQEKSYSIIQF